MEDSQMIATSELKTFLQDAMLRHAHDFDDFRNVRPHLETLRRELAAYNAVACMYGDDDPRQAMGRYLDSRMSYDEKHALIADATCVWEESSPR
jgi:hypothetical protein